MMRSPHTAGQTAYLAAGQAAGLATVRSSLLRLLAVASVALLAATFAWPAGAAHADRGLSSGVVAEDGCAEDDYDCWYQYFKDLLGGDDDADASASCAEDDYDCWKRYFKDLIGSSVDRTAADSCADDDYDCWYDYFKSLMPDDDDSSAPREEPRDLSLCVEGIDYAGTGCVEDYTGGTKSTEPAPRTSPTRVLATR